MLYANVGPDKVRATKGAQGWCPMCGSQVRAKCGDIVIWHWAHVSGADCDTWYEPESEWHLGWKKTLEQFGAQVEVTMTVGGETHRADAVLPDGTVVELQHGYLSPDKIRAREQFYGFKMLWIYDADQWSARIGWGNRRLAWSRPALSMSEHRRPVFWDLLHPFQRADAGPWDPVTTQEPPTVVMARHRKVDGETITEYEEVQAPPNEIVNVHLTADTAGNLPGRWTAYSYEQFLDQLRLPFVERVIHEHLERVDAADLASDDIVERIWAQVAAMRRDAEAEGRL